jgi:uncharacterized protein YndB with AHSA1/START domain
MSRRQTDDKCPQHTGRKRAHARALRAQGQSLKAISDPAELQRWFPDEAQLELRPGGKGAFSWDEYGTYKVQIVSVEPPNYLAWRRASKPDEEPEVSAGGTLVEWWLEDRPDGATRLRLRESALCGQRTRKATSKAGRRSWPSWSLLEGER